MGTMALVISIGKKRPMNIAIVIGIATTISMATLPIIVTAIIIAMSTNTNIAANTNTMNSTRESIGMRPIHMRIHRITMIITTGAGITMRSRVTTTGIQRPLTVAIPNRNHALQSMSMHLGECNILSTLVTGGAIDPKREDELQGLLLVAY